MKTCLLICFLVFIIYQNDREVQNERIFENPFFAFSNSMNKEGLPLIPLDAQADMLNKYGFDGIEHVEITNMMEVKEVFDREGLKIYANYVKIDIDKEEPYLKEWKEIIPKLEGTDILLWCHLHSATFKSSDQEADAIIIPLIQELADFAKPYGVKLAIYPHIWFLAEKPEDSFRIAEKVNRENVGTVFNLPHFLKTDSEENLEKILNLIFPRLFAVSICGADAGDTKNMDWLLVCHNLLFKIEINGLSTTRFFR